VVLFSIKVVGLCILISLLYGTDLALEHIIDFVSRLTGLSFGDSQLYVDLGLLYNLNAGGEGVLFVDHARLVEFY
jgi:hypothetical protein